MENSKSAHILTTSSNLLGFAFLVLTSIKQFGIPQKGIVDELVAVLIVVLASSCVFSFFSIRSKKRDTSAMYEIIADYLFLIGLIAIASLSILLGLDIVLFLK